MYASSRNYKDDRTDRLRRTRGRIMMMRKPSLSKLSAPNNYDKKEQTHGYSPAQWSLSRLCSGGFDKCFGPSDFDDQLSFHTTELSPILESSENFGKLSIHSRTSSYDSLDTSDDECPTWSHRFEAVFDRVHTANNSLVFKKQAEGDNSTHVSEVLTTERPSLMLTLPTPELPSTPAWTPSPLPLTVSQYVVAVDAGGYDAPAPPFPPCYGDNFGYTPKCSACEKQWLACTLWFHARQKRTASSHLERPYLRGEVSTATNRAIMGSLGLPIGSAKALAKIDATVPETAYGATRPHSAFARRHVIDRFRRLDLKLQYEKGQHAFWKICRMVKMFVAGFTSKVRKLG
ncbi:hypothetical protein SERLA73DRAFT_157950 [Serpula lacrymans var. lacrymans S7.3]|uniref:Uncharacterized protein n=2 Tax=Serpula lacrymans var. lacrymans TaxID=341189 RepID=F8PGI9_SERL3|nr:uncharacterized protein SERLADRAFT_412662 [Serpula lacrymans var. lacrymans S7.9]EGO05422.1 hypothetical protein SERLA73DRAFT_157950 [Serpula lacrymans var. lacrymans S7.3]EGO31268.1 hypothetical protein SERLADRAFT_412662 [Serpula lacrymans var. lacrymans S7.9]